MLRKPRYLVANSQRGSVSPGGMVEVVERSEADRDRTVANILADLRAHRVAGPIAAEIREAIELEEREVEAERSPWTGVATLAVVLAVLLFMWCRGIV